MGLTSARPEELVTWTHAHVGMTKSPPALPAQSGDWIDLHRPSIRRGEASATPVPAA
jgi:hypothetical protein